MERIREQGRLLVAVPYEGRPPPGDVNPSLTVYRGLAVELAQAVGDSIGVDVRFAPSASAAVARLPKDGALHLSFPLVPVTPELAGRSTLSDPYLTSYGSLMVASEAAAGQLDAGGRTCSSPEPWETRIPPNAPRKRIARPTPGACLELLVDGRVDAVAGPDVVLARLAYDECPRCVLTGRGKQEFFLSAVVPEGAEDFARYVSDVFAHARQDGRWHSWYRKWIGRFSERNAPPEVPDLDEALQRAQALHS